jgi:hypothetical protein
VVVAWAEGRRLPAPAVGPVDDASVAPGCSPPRELRASILSSTVVEAQSPPGMPPGWPLFGAVYGSSSPRADSPAHDGSPAFGSPCA